MEYRTVGNLSIDGDFLFTGFRILVVGLIVVILIELILSATMSKRIL